ncbi:MAG: HdeD family acid-resistance protein [Telluria sp.]
MNETLLRSWWMPALRGVVTVAFGLLALLCPDLAVVWLVASFAAYAVLGGAIWTAGALHNRRADARWRMPFMLGLLGIGAGVLALAHPAPTALVLVLLIAAHALATGLLDMVAALRLRKFIRGERLFALSALASIAFGIAVSIAPDAGALVFGPLVGVYALSSGIALLALALRVRAWAMQNLTGPAAGVVPV